MMVLVTHHVEEVPDGFTHAMLLRRGRCSRPGPLEEVFTARNLSRCFGVQLQIEHRQARWTARPAKRGFTGSRPPAQAPDGGAESSGSGPQLDASVGRHAGLEGWLTSGRGPVHDGAVGDHEGGSVPGAGDAGSAPLHDDPALMQGPTEMGAPV